MGLEESDGILLRFGLSGEIQPLENGPELVKVAAIVEDAMKAGGRKDSKCQPI